MEFTPFKCHPTAIVETENIGHSTKIWAYVHVMAQVEIGSECNIGDHAFIETGAMIGDRVTIKNGVMIWNGVRIANDVFIGPRVTFTNDLMPRSPRSSVGKDRYADTKWLVQTFVDVGASLGAASTIVCGIKIGKYAMVAAGAVVARNVPDYALVRGNPARICGWVSEYGCKLEFDDNNLATCDQTGTRWQLLDNRLQMLKDPR